MMFVAIIIIIIAVLDILVVLINVTDFYLSIHCTIFLLPFCMIFSMSIAITEVGTDAGIIDDETTFFVCPDESVNITCYTKQALTWLVSDMVVLFEKSDTIGKKDYIDGFNFTLIEIDGIDFTSLVEPKMNTSYNISCSPTGKAKDPVNSDITVSVMGEQQILCTLNSYINSYTNINSYINLCYNFIML